MHNKCMACSRSSRFFQDNEVFTAFVSIGYPYDNFKVLLMPSFAIAIIGRILQRQDALCRALGATPSFLFNAPFCIKSS